MTLRIKFRQRKVIFVIKTARKKQNLTQKILASRLGVSQSYISKLEKRNNMDHITLETIDKLCKILKLNKNNLINWFSDSSIKNYIYNPNDFIEYSNSKQKYSEREIYYIEMYKSHCKKQTYNTEFLNITDSLKDKIHLDDYIKRLF